jgi:hypothetical protein
MWKIYILETTHYLQGAQTQEMQNLKVLKFANFQRKYNGTNTFTTNTTSTTKFQCFFCNNVKGQRKNLKLHERGSDINSKLSFHVSSERRFGYKVESYIE